MNRNPNHAPTCDCSKCEAWEVEAHYRAVERDSDAREDAARKRETGLERWTRIAQEAKEISEGMRRMNPEKFEAAERSVRTNMANIPQFAALRKLH
jgi:hypothetical protein